MEERKHGRWVHKYGDGHEEPAITGGECSICGYIHTATNYCPNCGARMDLIGEDKSHPFAESVMMGMDGGENG